MIMLFILLYCIQYIFILIVNIISANIHVASIVLSRKINIMPETISIKTQLKSNICKVIFANSITLTPGTLTVNLSDNVLEIHCLDRQFVSGLENLTFEKILMKIEGVLQ